MIDIINIFLPWLNRGFVLAICLVGFIYFIDTMGMAFEIIKVKLYNGMLLRKLYAILKTSFVLIFLFYFMYRLVGITFGFSITNTGYNSDQFYRKVFIDYKKEIQTSYGELVDRKLGELVDKRFQKRLLFGLNGQIFDRSGNDSSAFICYNYDTTFIQRNYLLDKSNRNLIGRYRYPPRVGFGLENAFQSQLFNLDDNKIMKNGKDIKLSIDKNIQNYCYSLFNFNGISRKGCIVIMNPDDGDVIALVSSPGSLKEYLKDYNENDSIVNNLANDFVTASRFNVRKDVYSFGSAIKPIIGLIAANEGLDNFRTSLSEARILGVNERILEDEIPSQELSQRLDLKTALIQSRNYYFAPLSAKIFETIGAKKYQKYFLDDFGFNKKILWNSSDININSRFGIGMNESITSLFNTKYFTTYSKAWFDLGIGGQSSLEINPIHAAMIYSFISNGNFIPSPKIEKGLPLKEFLRPNIRQSSVLKIQQFLIAGVTDPRGTGYSLHDLSDLTIGSKTGTSTRMLSKYELKKILPIHLSEHKNELTGYISWNITFAQSRVNPSKKIVVVIVLTDALRKDTFSQGNPAVSEKGPFVARNFTHKIYEYLLKSKYFENAD